MSAMIETIQQRIRLLARASQNADLRHIEIALCRADIMHFFNNYLYTDRNDSLFGQDVPRVMPFIPMDFQKELILEIWNSIINGTFSAKDRWDFTNVFVEKSRQMGVSWLIMAVFLYGWLFHGHKYHVISQKETDVDKIGDMRSLFEKLRFMINNLPQWMLPEGFSKQADTSFNKRMLVSNPLTSASISGESANPNAGR